MPSSNDKKIEKLLNFADDAGLAMYDELTDLNDSISTLAESFNGVDLSNIQYIAGEKGEQGIPGKDGKDGAPGPIGPVGPQGKAGYDGYDGIDGKPGPAGPQGPKGDPGSADTGKQIVDKVNGLPIEPEYQIDAKHIKNLPRVSEKLAKDGYPYGLPQPAGAMTYKLNGAQVGRGNILNIAGSGITAVPLDDGITYNISGSGGGVTSLNTLTGAVILSAGTNISLVPAGNTITINSTGGGTIGGTIQQNQIGYGSGIDTLTSDGNFLRNLGDDRFSFASNTNTSNGIFYNGTGAPNALGNHAGLGLDFRAGTVLTTLGWVGIGSGTHLEISDTNLRTDLYTQDFYIRGYNNNVGFLSEITNTYSDVKLGDLTLANTQTVLSVLDSVAQIKMEGVFGKSFLADMSVNYTVSMGALDTGNSTKVVIDDTSGVTSVTGGNVSGGGLLVQDSALASWLRVDTSNAAHITTIGDISSVGNDTVFTVNDNAHVISAKLDTFFTVENITLNSFFKVDIANQRYRLGDMENQGNGTYLDVDDFSSRIDNRVDGDFLVRTTVGARLLRLDRTNNLYAVGDIDTDNNGTFISIDDTAQVVKITNVPTYANDAAATGGGLTTGQLYKTTTGGITSLNIVP